jgi:hypothetical protein
MNKLLKFVRHGLALAVICIGAGVLLLSPASARPDPADQVFATVTERMEAARVVQFCAFVAQHALTLAAEAPTQELQARRETEARRLQARLATHLERANASLSAADLQRIERENNEYMGLLSHAPSREIGSRLNDPAVEQDFLGLFLSDIVSRCNGTLDARGIGQAGTPGLR